MYIYIIIYTHKWKYIYMYVYTFGLTLTIRSDDSVSSIETIQLNIFADSIDSINSKRPPRCDPVVLQTGIASPHALL